MSARLVVLASGGGTTLEALLEAVAASYEVVAVISDQPECVALQRAARRGIPAQSLPLTAYPDRDSWDSALAATIARFEPDWVVSAGFMRILGPAVLARFESRIVNTHPALLPAFPGAHAVPDALAYGVKVAGCTIHLVDAGVDTGPIIAQASVPVEPGDDADVLHERIKQVERALLVSTMNSLAVHGCTIDGRKVTIP